MQKAHICVLLIIIASVGLTSFRPRASADAPLTMKGMWNIDFIVPDSPKGNRFGIPHRHDFDFREENGVCRVYSLDDFDVRVPGTWRVSGDQFSATFELYCINATCGTILMRGAFDSRTQISGQAIIFWDSPDNTTPTGYDTVSGTFTGKLCISLAHDKEGCHTE